MDGFGRGRHRRIRGRIDVDVMHRLGEDRVGEVEDRDAQAPVAEVCGHDDAGAAAQRQQDAGTSTRS